MEILAWLVFPLGVTAVAMAWAAWAGRPRRDRAGEREREMAYERFAAALRKPHPGAGKAVPPAPVAPASGIALRRGQTVRPAPPPR